MFCDQCKWLQNMGETKSYFIQQEAYNNYVSPMDKSVMGLKARNRFFHFIFGKIRGASNVKYRNKM